MVKELPQCCDQHYYAAEAVAAVRARIFREVVGPLQTELAEEREKWKFVPDERGGHMLTSHGDKWYPEEFTMRVVGPLVEALEGSGRSWGDLERGMTQAIERGFTKVHTGDLLIAAKFQRTSCDAALAKAREHLAEPVRGSEEGK